MLRKVVADHPRDCHERLPEALWSYRTSARLSTDVTPFMLVYETEAVLPLEVELPALRMTVAAQLDPDHEYYVAGRIAALEALDEHRRKAEKKLRRYHGQVARYYDRRANIRQFILRMLVLCNTRKVRADLPI